LRVIGRGLRDTYDSLFAFCLASLLWWIAVFPPILVLWPLLSGFAVVGFLVFGPAATIALFAATDPRRGASRPDLAELVTTWRTRLTQSWKLAALTLPLPLVLVNNIIVFGGSSNWLVNLVPLWTVLLVITLSLFVVSFGVAGLFELPLRETLKRATFVLVAAPFRTLFVLVAIVLLTILCGVLVVPIILFGPAMVGAILDRHLVQVFGLPVIDPNAPTDERIIERRSAPPSRGRFWERR
jgi:uncharacterized membrane protein YesL